MNIYGNFRFTASLGLIWLASVAVTLATTSVQHVRPPDTDPAIIDTIGMQHVATVNTSVDSKRLLVVLLPDRDTSPEEYQRFLCRAADLGYHAVGLKYVNEGTSATDCCAESAHEECYEYWREEEVEGRPSHPKISVDRANSIENRLVRLLQWLQSNYPAQNWSQFLDGDESIKWAQLVVAGHGEGCGNAAFIAEKNLIERCLLFGRGDWWAKESKPAPWIGGAGRTRPWRYYGFLHTDSPEATTAAEVWSALDMDIAGGSAVVEKSAGTRFDLSHQLLTEIPLTGTSPNPRGATILDSATPLRGGIPIYRVVWDYMLSAPLLKPPSLGIGKGGKKKLRIRYRKTKLSQIVEQSESLEPDSGWSLLDGIAVEGNGEIVTEQDVAFGERYFRLRDTEEPSSILAPMPGLHSVKMTSGGDDRLVEVVVPPGYDHREASPLVFVNHGTGQSASGFRKQHPDLLEEAALRNMILVFPQALPNNTDGRRAWTTNPQDTRSHDDADFFDAILAKAKSVLNIDENKVYCAGFSGGGVMAYTLGIRRPGVFAAIAACGSSIGYMDLTTKQLVEPPAAPKPIPVMIINGKKDLKRPWNGRAFDPTTGATAVASVSDAIKYWKHSNGIPIDAEPTSSQSLHLGGINIAQFLDGDPDQPLSEVYFVGLEHARHIWPDRDDYVNYDANKQVLAFFDRWCLDGAVPHPDCEIPTTSKAVDDLATASPVERCHELFLWDQGCRRQFFLFLPEAYDGSTPTDLVIANHGGGGNARNFANQHPDLLTHCENEGWLLVYPNGTENPITKKNNWSNNPVGVTIDDVAFFKRLVEKLQGGLNIDDVFATGFSAGGGVLYRVAAECPGVFDAIAPVGSPFAWNDPITGDLILPEPPLASIPVMCTYGRLDRRRPWNGGINDKCKFTASVDQLVDYWLGGNACIGTGTITTASPIAGTVKAMIKGVCGGADNVLPLSGFAVTTTTWDNCDDGSLFILNDLAFMDHEWEDPDDVLIDVDGISHSVGFDTNSEVIAFFKDL